MSDSFANLARPWRMRAQRAADMRRAKGRLRNSRGLMPREWRKASGWHTYELAGTDLEIAMRHGSGSTDLSTFIEIFVDDVYAIPGEMTEVFPESPRVLDLGANVGYFAALALSRWGAVEVLSYEPDPASFELAAHLAGQTGGRASVLAVAASNVNGRMELAARGTSTSSLLRTASPAGEPAVTVAVEDVLPRMRSFDVVKIDIEGSEWAILEDERLRETGPPFLVLEYHPRPDELEPGALARGHLLRAGYEIVSHQIDEDSPEGFGVYWAQRGR